MGCGEGFESENVCLLCYVENQQSFAFVLTQVSDKHSVATGGRMGRRPGPSTTSSNGRADAPLFAGNVQGGLSGKYAGEPHLKDPLDPR